MQIIGIDPGKQGAIAILEGGKVVDIQDCPLIDNQYDERAMAEIVARYRGKVFIEKVHAMPQQGVTSMFSFGKGLGIWLGICAALKVSYFLVAPQTWKKALLKDMPKEKASSVIVAKRLFPDAERFLVAKKHHNRADALLIAEYGRRLNV